MAASPWVVRFKSSHTSTIRLFCLPYAGGGASAFRTWATALPESVELYAIQLPGREDRLLEQPFASIDHLLPYLANGVMPFLDKPFALFGHSMGALISYELTHYLRTHTQVQPLHLFMSGFGSPKNRESNQEQLIHTLSSVDLLKELRHLNGTPPEILHNAEFMEMILPTLRSDFSMCENYKFVDRPLLDCCITALGGIRDLSHSEESLSQWSQLTRGHFNLRLFPGDHFFLHSDRVLVLQSLLEELEDYRV